MNKFCTKIESLTKWPFLFLKTEGFTERPLLYINLTKWPPIFLLSSLKDPFFLYLVRHRKTPTLRVLAAHPHHSHIWVPPPIASCIICIIQELHPLINWTKHTFTAETKCTKFYPPSRMVRVKRLDCNADMHAVTHLMWCHIHSQSGRLDTFLKNERCQMKGQDQMPVTNC